jgi:hypothetical protein
LKVLKVLVFFQAIEGFFQNVLALSFRSFERYFDDAGKVKDGCYQKYYDPFPLSII